MAQSTSPHGAPGPAEAHSLSQAGEKLLAAVGEALHEFHPQPGAVKDLPQVIIESQGILSACKLAKSDPRLSFERLLCLACVDYKEYFQLVYILHSMKHEQTLVIKTSVPYGNPRLPSVTTVWKSADWYEREAHDLFGVAFDGHPGLTPLLLYEGFEGYPGRKAFPFHEYQEF